MKRRVLVVEDNPSILKLTRDLLTSKGYEVTAVSDPERVFDGLEETPPHLILMDVQLPGTDGLTLTRQLRARPETRDTVILAFTAFAMKEDQERAMEAGCNGYISKPVQISTFLSTIDSYLANGTPAPAREPAPPPAAAPEAAGAGPGGRILVIDDSPAVTKLLETVLTVGGYEVVVARNGREGMDMLRLRHPDLVVTDVAMPEMDGFEVCRAIKGDPATRLLPVVMITAFGDSAKKIQGIEAGADDFIDKPFNHHELMARIKSLVRSKFLNDQLETAHNVIMAMARVVEAKDRFTAGHIERVSRYCVELGRAAGLGPAELASLEQGGILHDIGKVHIPDAVLNKEGRLDEDEWRQVRMHPTVGAEILEPLKALARILPLVLYHHERLDGSGYPHGLQGDDIPLPVRILSIADVYDALTNQRSYKPPLPRERAFEILREEARRGWWDADLVELFVEQRMREGQP